MIKKLILAVLMVSVISSTLLAIPKMINFQGRILEDGNPVNGNRDMIFRFYDSAEGGEPLLSWQDEKQNVPVNNGIFNTKIGSDENPIPKEIFIAEDAWVEVEIEGDKLPRQKLLSVGYAFKAADAETLNGRKAEDFISISTTIINQNFFVLPGTNPVLSASEKDATITIANDTRIKGKLSIGTNTVTIDNYSITFSSGPGPPAAAIISQGCGLILDTDTGYLKLNTANDNPILTGEGDFLFRGNLGVGLLNLGETSARLHILQSGAPIGVSPEAGCIIQNSSGYNNAELYLITSGDGDSEIHFGDLDNAKSGSISLDNNGANFYFKRGVDTFMSVRPFGTPANRLVLGGGGGRFRIDIYGEKISLYGNTSVIGDLTVTGNLDVAGDIGVPGGVIVMWSGASDNIPDGWALCDGTNGTPDLRGRFIMGATTNYPVGYKSGSMAHTHYYYDVPSHSHGITDNGHMHKYWRSHCGESTKKGSGHHVCKNDWISRDTESKKTGISINFEGVAKPETESASNLPPYYVLCYIMKL